MRYRNEEATYVQSSHAYGRCSAPALAKFKPRSGRFRRAPRGPMPHQRSGCEIQKGKLTLSLSWHAKSDSERRGLCSFPIWPATTANQNTPQLRFANWFCSRAASLSKEGLCADRKFASRAIEVTGNVILFSDFRTQLAQKCCGLIWSGWQDLSAPARSPPVRHQRGQHLSLHSTAGLLIIHSSRAITQALKLITFLSDTLL